MVEDTIEPTCTFLACKAVMLGTYYFVPQDRVIISESGIRIGVPDLKDRTNFVSVELKIQDTLKVFVNFENKIPVLFIWASSAAGHAIREQLGMHDPKGLYYDPVGSDERQRRLILLPEIISEESKLVLKTLFQPNKAIEELASKVAYIILARATPKNIWPQLKHSIKEAKKAIGSRVDDSVSDGTQTQVVELVTELPQKSIKLSEESSSNINSVIKSRFQRILIYPPHPAKGGIALNTEDYACLNEDKFLNDNIIDFYLKYLTLEILSKEDRNRTHVFSSHFYTRLTSTNQAADESDISLTPAEKLHAKVSKWTKDVNIFTKDFILIPIMENAHWFLAIICFPNLVGEVEENVIALREYDAKQKSPKFPNVRNKKVQTVETFSEIKIRKLPCILIFDSLAGSANQSQVAARLRDYLTYEYLAKMGTKKMYSTSTIKVNRPKVPQQSNYSDCGVYVLQYAESFFKDPIEDYTLPIKTLEYWFEEIVVTRKRKALKNLITNLANNQQ